MTRLELMTMNKKHYQELLLKIPEMSGLEQAVAQHITLAWIKGSQPWIGGLGSGKYADRAFAKVQELGYDDEDIFNEFDRQMHFYMNLWNM